MIGAVIFGILALSLLLSGDILLCVIFGGGAVFCLLAHFGKDETPKKTSVRALRFNSEQQRENFHDLLTACIRFVDACAGDFDYLYYEYNDSNVKISVPLGLIETSRPSNYVKGCCLVAVRPNGTALCFNFKAHGNFELTLYTIEYLGDKLAEHYNGRCLTPREDFHAHYFDGKQNWPVPWFIVVSPAGLQKHEAVKQRQQAEQDSIRRC